MRTVREGLFWVSFVMGRMTDLSVGDWCLVAFVALTALTLIVYTAV